MTQSDIKQTILVACGALRSDLEDMRQVCPLSWSSFTHSSPGPGGDYGLPNGGRANKASLSYGFGRETGLYFPRSPGSLQIMDSWPARRSSVYEPPKKARGNAPLPKLVRTLGVDAKLPLLIY